MRAYRALGIALIVHAGLVLTACTPEAIAAYIAVTNVVVRPDTVELDTDDHSSLTAVGYNSFSLPIAGVLTTWSSSDPTIAQVSQTGEVLGVAEGTATITATIAGKEGRSTVKVRRPPVATVTVSPSTATIIAGQTIQLRDTLRSASGRLLTGRSVVWSSGSPSIATVSSSGLVTGVAAGTAVITATCEGKSGSATITVNAASPAPVASVTVTPASPSIVAGGTAQLTATAKDANGNVLSGRTTTWSTSNASVATVNAAGLVTAVAVGTATITALVEGVSGTSAVTVTAPAPPSGNDPELPRVILDTRYVAPTGQTIAVPSGGSLQAALNSAQPCDVITLAAGATYTGPFTLPVKSGSCFITIRSAAPDANLPAEGVRMTPAYASALPKLVSPNDGPAVRTAAGAHHYRFIAVEITVASSATLNYGIVALGDGSSAQNAMSLVPTNLILDRVYIHGHSALNVSRCVGLNSAATAVIDSYLSECHAKGFDSQAIGGWNGPGPYKIANNYLEGAGEILMFGGADPSITNLTPSDIEIRHNHFSRPTSWKGVWTVKNLFELKHAQRLLVEGNVLENHWVDAQDGFAIVLKSVNQDGSAPWSVMRDLTFRYNYLRNASGGINLAAKPEASPAEPASHVKIAHNIFDNINVGVFTGHGRLFQILGGPGQVTIEHNTTINSDASNAAVMFDGAPPQAANFVYRNNVTTKGQYGVFGSNQGEGKSALDFYAAPGYVFVRNVIVGANASIYPADNFFPASLTQVGFVNLAGGNYRLASGSAYKQKGTDGTDPGANVDAVEAAIQGVIIP